MNRYYSFLLEPYRSGGRNRYQCPSCGRMKCFTRYVATDTGRYVADECGKCDHLSSCGYHYPPAEYFRDHPEESDRQCHSPGGRHDRSWKVSRSASAAMQDCVQTEFYPTSWVEKAAERGSTFRSWMERLPFDAERVKEVFADYCVGGTTSDTYVHGCNYGPSVVFWAIDEQQRVHDAKLMAYTADGHRVQDGVGTLRAVCAKKRLGPQLERTEKVLFGLHLLPRYPDKVVCIVESEKTALVCACRYPDYLWLATGGCGNLQLSKLRVLMNRRLVIFPDSGEYEAWNRRMLESGHRHYVVVNLLEAYAPNTDIADIILGEAVMTLP